MPSNEPKKSERQRRLIAAAVGAIGVLVVLGKVFWPRPSLEEVGEAALSCIVTGDDDCLAEFSYSEEVERLGYDKSILLNYKKEFLKPLLSGVNPVSGFKSLVLEDRGWVIVSKTFITPEGVAVPFQIRMANTKEGPKAPTLIFESFLMAAHSQRDSKLTAKLGSIQGVARTAREKGPLLEALGLKGVWRDSPDQVLTWEDLALENEERLRKTKAILEGQSQTSLDSSPARQ